MRSEVLRHMKSTSNQKRNFNEGTRGGYQVEEQKLLRRSF